jgi:hypothetical protein
MSKRKHTNEQFIEAIKNSLSVASALAQLNLKPAGGNYDAFHKRVKELNIDTSHFTGQGHLKNKPCLWHKEIPLKEILKENVYYNSSSLRKRLIKEKIFEPKCSCCSLDVWLDQPISLELDHINGIKTDNRISNLRILCPNCHAQTPTYRSKNRKK